MKYTYVTFGQSHRHEIDDTVFDKDCVARIPADSWAEGREKAFKIFGPKFCFEYHDTSWDEAKQLSFFPRGYIDINLAEPQEQDDD